MGIVEEYRQKLLIDYSRMQEMLETQASRHSWMVEQSAETNRVYAELKSKLDVVKAQAYKRLKAQTENGKPMTDKSATAYLAAEPEVIEITKAVNDAQYDAKILDGAVTSFQQRKTMLQKIAEREVMGFYGDPKMTGKTGNRELDFENHLKDSFSGRIKTDEDILETI